MQFPEKNPRCTIRIAHSPDADDRFMFWPLRAGLVSDPEDQFAFRWSEADTQGLNRLAASENPAVRPEVCAISVFHYASVHLEYQPLRMGCSVGDDYGPVIVARRGTFPGLSGALLEQVGRDTPDALRVVEHGRIPGQAPTEIRETLLLTPGAQTTAHNVTRLLGYGLYAWEAVPIVPIEGVFERLEALESEGRPALALLIHEGRLLFERYGCERVLDIGKAWHARTNGSLPLGMNVVRRDLPLPVRERLSALFIASCRYALAHREEFLDEAARPGSPYHTPLSRTELSAYLGLYANETTASVLPSDARAFERLFAEAHAAGFLESDTAVPCDWI
jgi:1,4-dihydroxy-6-naphthoate synthase